MRDDYDHPSDWEPVKITKETEMQIMTANKNDAPNWVKETPLIAAAPELLEACKLALVLIGHPDDEGTKFIAAAIAKAEGK